MAHDVFISYSKRDKATADAVVKALESSGISCWVAPRDIEPGETWAGAIVDAIGASRAFVLLFSSDSNGSKQVMREVSAAEDAGIRVITFKVEDAVPSKELAYYIGPTHWLDAHDPPLEPHLERLCDALQSHLGVPAIPPVVSGSTRNVSPDAAPVETSPAVRPPDPPPPPIPAPTLAAQDQPHSTPSIPATSATAQAPPPPAPVAAAEAKKEDTEIRRPEPPESCWFCKRPDAPLDTPYEVGMARAASQRRVPVPRCARCLRVHRRIHALEAWEFMLAPAAAIGIAVNTGIGDVSGISLTLSPLLLCAVGIPPRVLAGLSRTRTTRAALNYPRLKTLKQEGWK